MLYYGRQVRVRTRARNQYPISSAALTLYRGIPEVYFNNGHMGGGGGPKQLFMGYIGVFTFVDYYVIGRLRQSLANKCN